MKQLFLIVFLLQIQVVCVAQTEEHVQKLDAASMRDFSTQTEFNQYLDFIFACTPEKRFEVDTSLNYRLRFVTSHPFQTAHDLSFNFFADSLKRICIANPKSVQDSILSLSFLDPTAPGFEHTRLLKDPSVVLTVFAFRKLNPHTGEPYNGSASFHFDADTSNLLSFNAGQFLLICETRFSPDIRGGMPPGSVVTYFLELAE